MSKLIFWLHFLIATLSHIFIILMPLGVIQLVVDNDNLGFFVKALLLGLTFYSFMYCVNHVTNGEGFCILNSLENSYRKKEGLSEVGTRFTPRYYKKWREVFKWLQRKLKKK